MDDPVAERQYRELVEDNTRRARKPLPHYLGDAEVIYENERRGAMNYRPEGWSPSYIRQVQIMLAGATYQSADYEISLVEAGADAMYEALREWREENCTEHDNAFPMKRVDCIYCQDELWEQQP